MTKKAFLVVFALTGIFCQSDSPTALDNGGGNTSETTNGVTLVRSGDDIRGRTRPFAFVGIYSSDFVGPKVWGTSDSTVADLVGAFSFESPAHGTYNLIARDPATGMALRYQNLIVDSDSIYITEGGDFSPTGVLVGVLRDKDSTIFPYSFCFLVGTPFYTVSDSLGKIRYDDLPAGEYTVGIPTISAVEEPGRPGTYEEKRFHISSDSTTIW
jgi:hypothetical protein